MIGRSAINSYLFAVRVVAQGFARFQEAVLAIDPKAPVAQFMGLQMGVLAHLFS